MRDCPIARALDAIGDWWSLLIIRDALLGRRRFGEFQKSLGLAKNILTVRLRALVDRGILAMAPASDGSAYQEYVLTPKGRGLFPVLVALAAMERGVRRDARGDRDHPGRSRRAAGRSGNSSCMRATAGCSARRYGAEAAAARHSWRAQRGHVAEREFSPLDDGNPECGSRQPRLLRSRDILLRLELRHRKQMSEHVLQCRRAIRASSARSASDSAMKLAASSAPPSPGGLRDEVDHGARALVHGG